MPPSKDPQELLRELEELGRAIDGERPTVIDDALEELGQPQIGRGLRTGDIPVLEEALRHGGDPGARKFLEGLLENLRRQREILDDLHS
jgi:hypothetical protein